MSERQDHIKESVRTSQAITPKLYISLVLVVSDELFMTSGALLRESRPGLVLPSTTQAAERRSVDASPRLAMRGVPPLSISMFV